MKNILLFLMCFPLFIFGDFCNLDKCFGPQTNSTYGQKFAQCLIEQDLTKGREVLQRWNAECPEDIPYITGCYSTLYLMDGKIEKSKQVMQSALDQLYMIGYPTDLIDTIVDLFLSLPEGNIEEVSQASLVNFHLCKGKQPKGLKFKYWIGVAQIAGGCLLMPFNPVAGGTLIGTGASCLIDATSNALDNKEKWEQDLNNRQRIQPDNYDPKPQPNSFYDSRSSRFQL